MYYYGQLCNILLCVKSIIFKILYNLPTMYRLLPSVYLHDSLKDTMFPKRMTLISLCCLFSVYAVYSQFMLFILPIPGLNKQTYSPCNLE